MRDWCEAEQQTIVRFSSQGIQQASVTAGLARNAMDVTVHGVFSTGIPDIDKRLVYICCDIPGQSQRQLCKNRAAGASFRSTARCAGSSPRGAWHAGSGAGRPCSFPLANVGSTFLRTTRRDATSSGRGLGGIRRKSGCRRNRGRHGCCEHRLLGPHGDLSVTITGAPKLIHVRWWRRGGSNSRPRHCERRALPAELRPHAANQFSAV